MSGNPRKLGYREVLPGMLAIYAFVIVWEVLTTPMISHTNSWQGVGLSLLALPVGAFVLARYPGAPSRFFVYGAAGSLLFVWRFINMDRFSLWLEYRAPSTTVIVTCWVLFSVGMGTVCWVAAKARESPSDTTRSGHAANA
jgi:hypothetical protein